MLKKHGDPLIKGVSSSRFKPGVKPKNYSGIDICTVEGCVKKHRSKGYCQTHFMRLYHHGDANYKPKKIRGTVIQRLKHMTQLNEGTGCIEWQGSVDKRGYGRIANDVGWLDMAHRLSYKLYVGEIPEGLVINHKCYNSRCVNPEHLEAVTHRENIIDKGRSNAAYLNSKKTHCIRGHDLTVSYIIKTKYGFARNCKQCHKERTTRYLRRIYAN